MHIQEEESDQEDDKVLMKRFASGEPMQKQFRFDEEYSQVQDQGQVLGAGRVSRRPVFTPKERPHKKTCGPRKKEALGERGERYDFLNSLARAPAGITFGEITYGDVDKLRKELQKIVAKKVTRSAVNVTSEDRQRKVPPNRHQVVWITVYSEPVYGILDTSAIPNVISDTLVEKLRLNLTPTKRRIVVADGTTGACTGILEAIPVSFGSIVVRLNFMVIKSLPYDLNLGSPPLVDMCPCIDLYHQTAKVRKDGQTETLNPVYEPEMYEDTEDELTTDTESDRGEESDKDEYSAFVITLSDVSESPAVEKSVDTIDEKIAHLSEEYTAEVRHLFQSYPHVIAYSFDDIRPSKCKTTHRFELTSEEPIFQKLRRLPPKFNDIMKKEIDRMLTAGIITPVEPSWTSPIVLVTKKDGIPRFCIDCRKLNAVMKQDRWPLPLIDELFDEVKESTVFKTLDLCQRYWQIKMHESCKEMDTFICRYGTFQF